MNSSRLSIHKSSTATQLTRDVSSFASICEACFNGIRRSNDGSAADTEIHTVPDGGHNDCYTKGGERYYEVMQQFIQRVLREDSHSTESGPTQETLKENEEEGKQPPQETRRRGHNQTADISAE